MGTRTSACSASERAASLRASASSSRPARSAARAFAAWNGIWTARCPVSAIAASADANSASASARRSSLMSAISRMNSPMPGQRLATSIAMAAASRPATVCQRAEAEKSWPVGNYSVVARCRPSSMARRATVSASSTRRAPRSANPSLMSSLLRSRGSSRVLSSIASAVSERRGCVALAGVCGCEGGAQPGPLADPRVGCIRAARRSASAPRPVRPRRGSSWRRRRPIWRPWREGAARRRSAAQPCCRDGWSGRPRRAVSRSRSRRMSSDVRRMWSATSSDDAPAGGQDSGGLEVQGLGTPRSPVSS